MGATRIIFILVLLLVSGIVAWAGDVLGRTLGKRRIALFGLRPRNTSLLIAVITGMLITGLTILTLALASENIRYTLIHMDEIRRDIQNLISERDSAWLERDELQKEIENRKKALELQMIQINDLTGQLSIAETELLSVQQELGELKIQADKYQDEVSALIKERDELKSEFETTKKEKEERVAKLEAHIDVLSNEISQKEQRVKDLNDKINELHSEIQEWAGGRVKVKEGQRLAAFSVDTSLDSVKLDDEIGTKLAAIRYNYVDPVTNEKVLVENEMVIPGDEYIRAIREIKAIPSAKAIVMAYALKNVLENEPVMLRIEVTSDFQVYPSGTVIFSKIVDAPEGSSDPFRAVIAGFMEDAKDYLVNQRRLIPYGTGELIQLTIDDLVKLAERLKSVGLPAEIKMIALTDIYRTDFLIYKKQFDLNLSRSEKSEPD